MKKLTIAIAACLLAGAAVADPEFVTCPSAAGGTITNSGGPGPFAFTFSTTTAGFQGFSGGGQGLDFTGATYSPVGCDTSQTDSTCTMTLDVDMSGLNPEVSLITLEAAGLGVVQCGPYDFAGGTMPVDLQAFSID